MATPQEYFLNPVISVPGIKNDDHETSRVLFSLLSGIRAYQFHDTSDTARIKDRCYVDDAGHLRHDAGNLAAFLKMLKGYASYEKYYNRIVRHIQRVMPQFGDFDLELIPGSGEYVRLNWRDSFNGDYLFDPHQISDGSLRFMALAALLLQPPDLLPKFIVLDEPELGLHPAAISELAGMVKIAAQHTQVLLATQSTRLVDEFDLENLVIVERDPEKHCSVFKKLQAEQLEDWLARYSLSELWEKNVLGGQP
jgi:predicted ATPase